MDANNLIGKVLHDTHRVTGVLGSGGMGTVYLAEHIRLKHKHFAIKVLHASLGGHKEVLARFKREAEIATALGHPNIVDVLDFYDLEDGRPCMVMEHLEGEDLRRRMKREGRLSHEELASIVDQAAAGLQAAHDRGITHRDLKPENIFLVPTPSGRDHVKVLDFGISKIKDSTSILTHDDALIGTPLYMSPEQAVGKANDVDYRSDLFSLGSICFEGLYGEPPFDAPTTPGIIYHVCESEPDPGPDSSPPFEGELKSVLLRAMAKEKGERHERVETFVGELLGALGIEGERRSETPSPQGRKLLDESPGLAPLFSKPATVVERPGSPELESPELESSEPGLSQLEVPQQRKGVLIASGVFVSLLLAAGVLYSLWGAGGAGGPSGVTKPARGAKDRIDERIDKRLKAADKLEKKVDKEIATKLARADKLEKKVDKEIATKLARAEKVEKKAGSEVGRGLSKKKRATAGLRLVGLPAGARVTIEGVNHPERPLRLPKSKKRTLRLEVRAKGYQLFTREIPTKGAPRVLTVKMIAASKRAVRPSPEAPKKAPTEPDKSKKLKKGWIVDPVIK